MSFDQRDVIRKNVSSVDMEMSYLTVFDWHMRSGHEAICGPQGYQMFLLFWPGVGNCSIQKALHVCMLTRLITCLVSAFLVHSTSFFWSQSLSKRKGVVCCEQWIVLLVVWSIWFCPSWLNLSMSVERKNRKLFTERFALVFVQVSVPAETHTVQCGVDHTIALCKSFTWSTGTVTIQVGWWDGSIGRLSDSRKIYEFFLVKNVLTRCRCAPPLCVYTHIRMMMYAR